MSFENAGSTIMSVLFGVVDESNRIRDVYLERFVHQYSQPLVDFLRKAKMQTEEDANDLVQTFWVSKLLQPPPSETLVAKYLSAVARSEVKSTLPFRQYLLRSISNQLLDCLRSKKRLGAVSLDQLEGFDVVSQQDIEIFDNAWANRLLRTVINNVHDECRQNNQMEMWNLFLRQLIVPRLTNSSPPGYAELALTMGFRDARSAANAVRTVIRKFQSHMRRCIGEYLPVNSLAESEAGISVEFDEIIAMLSKPGALDHSMFDDVLKDSHIVGGIANGNAGHFSSISVKSEESFWSSPEKTMYASDADVECRWIQLCDLSIVSWLEPLGGKLNSPSVATLKALTRSEFLPEQTIVEIRNVAKRASREPEDEPVVLYGLIYLLAIAVGFEHHNRIFSSDTAEKIKLRMNQMVEFSWLDNNSRETLHSFIRANSTD